MTTQPSPGRVLVSGGASGLGRAVALAVRDAGGLPVVLGTAAVVRAALRELVVAPSREESWP